MTVTHTKYMYMYMYKGSSSGWQIHNFANKFVNGTIMKMLPYEVKAF